MNIDCPEVNKNLLKELRDKSLSSDKEICGFLFNDSFIECENIHPDPENFFLISPKDYLWKENLILFHSHGKNHEIRGFSEWDLENQFYFQLKMLLYSVKYDEFYFKDL